MCHYAKFVSQERRHLGIYWYNFPSQKTSICPETKTKYFFPEKKTLTKKLPRWQNTSFSYLKNFIQTTISSSTLLLFKLFFLASWQLQWSRAVTVKQSPSFYIYILYILSILYIYYIYIYISVCHWDESHNFETKLWDKDAGSCPALAILVSDTQLHRHWSTTSDSYPAVVRKGTSICVGKLKLRLEPLWCGTDKLRVFILAKWKNLLASSQVHIMA